MSMPPYLRFPQNGQSIRQKIWSFRPVNPSCGYISLENGTKYFAQINMIMAGFGLGLCLLAIVFLSVAFSKHPGHEALLKEMKQSESSKKGDSPDDWIDKIYARQSYAVLIVACSFVALFFTAVLFLNSKLKKAVIERDISMLKKCFLIMLVIEILSIPAFDFETDLWTATTLIFDVPLTIFTILGLVFTYSFISSLVNPEPNSETDDLSRIQFSP